MPAQFVRRLVKQVSKLTQYGLEAIPEDESCHFKYDDTLYDDDTTSSTSHDDDLPNTARTSQSIVVMKNLENFDVIEEDAEEGIDRVNYERQIRGIHHLRKSSHLEQMARKHARLMAKHGCVMHSVQSLEELEEILERQYVGENIQCGNTIEEMHRMVMDGCELADSRENILGKEFDEFGMAMERGIDGKVYLCQYFCDA